MPLQQQKVHTHGWIPTEELKNGYTQTDSMPTVKELRKQAKSYGFEVIQPSGSLA